MTTQETVALVAMWSSFAVNVGIAVRTYVARKREAREVRCALLAGEDLLRKFAPMIAFVATLRDTPSVPVELRRAAADVLPPEVEITPIGGTVH